MDSPKASASHGVIFSMLVVLVLLAVGVNQLHLGALANNLAVLAAAFLMSGLVVAQYMGLRLEGPIVVALFVVPLVLFAILVALLMPDIAHVPVHFLEHG